jgi:hypothetical protein
MRNFLVAGLLAVGAVASPLVERAQTCMTTKDSVKVAQNFRALIHETFNTTLAKTAMTAQFHDYSGKPGKEKNLDGDLLSTAFRFCDRAHQLRLHHPGHSRDCYVLYP